MVNTAPTVQAEHEAFIYAAEKALTRIAPQVDRRVRELSGIQETLSKRVSTAIDEPNRMTPEGLALAQEVRSHVKSLAGKARNAFVVEAIKTNDKATVAAVLHAQAVASTIRPDEKTWESSQLAYICSVQSDLALILVAEALPALSRKWLTSNKKKSHCR